NRGIDAAHGRHFGEGEGAAVDQSRQGAARRPEDVSRLLRVSDRMLRQPGLAIVGGTALLMLAHAGAHAQSAFPARAITLVVPYPAGGTADLLCRFAGDKVGASLGQQVVVENRPGGAGGRIGIEQVLRARPDGYTLLCGTQLNYSITHLVFRKAAFDPRSLEPISVLATYPLIVIARASLPASSMAELLAFARANPGKLTYGHQGKGNT